MLKRSKDRKVANSVTASGKTVRIANSFGLPAGKSCPGKTSICNRVCYAGKIERIPTMAGPRNVVNGNFQELLYADYLQGADGMTDLLMPMIEEFDKECDKWEAEKIFRIHWDGDFWSESYAQAWKRVMLAYPAIQFWVYTRTFTDDLDIVPIIADIPNLTLYLSVDDENRELARSKYPAILWADLNETFADSEVKGYKCPENRGSLPLISEKGSACARCGVCVLGRGNVLFSVSKS